jgi:hypothetical protein
LKNENINVLYNNSNIIILKYMTIETGADIDPVTIENNQNELIPTPVDKAVVFCSAMGNPTSPMDFRLKVVDILKDWTLLDKGFELTNNSDGSSEYRKVILDAQNKAEENSLEFNLAFLENPLKDNGFVEGNYTEDELPRIFPRAEDIKNVLNENVNFSFRADQGNYLRIVNREDGKRQVIRFMDSKRDADTINNDAKKVPEIVPPFEAITLPDGKIGLLIQYIDGHPPSTLEELELCSNQVEGLLRVPVDDYDFWGGNFVITEQVDSVTGLPKVFYVDQDIPKKIAENGYALDITDEKRQAFDASREKMLKMYRLPKAE